MWTDNIAEIDVLNYRPYCDVLMDIVYNSSIDNTTIGLYGNWGSGKSTILNFFQKKIDKDKYGCININAWVFEGYGDIKKALIKTILEELESNTSLYKIQINKIKELKRTNFLQLGANVLPEVASLTLNLLLHNIVPVPSILTKLKNKILNKEIKIDIDGIKKDFLKEVEEDNNELKNIRLFRKKFEEAVEESKLDRFIIIIDDLDRCAPERIIDCLEAVKLFLSVKKVIFIIAVDNRIVEYSVKAKYPEISGIYDIQKDYLNKIIQIPITIHQLVEEDISNYLFLLVLQQHIKQDIFEKFVSNSNHKNIFTYSVTKQINVLSSLFDLSQEIYKEKSTKELLMQDLDVINEIRDIVSGSLGGSPREAKKFLNTFFIRKSLLQLYFVDNINLSILAKLMALEIIDKKLYSELNYWVLQYPDIVEPLKNIMQSIEKGEDLQAEFQGWNNEKVINWLRTNPKDLYNENLSKYFYLSRSYKEGRALCTDITMTCRECGNEFIFTAGEQAFYAERGFNKQPERCSDCRRSRKNNRRNNNY